MTDKEQIEALKAQVNYLREVLDGLAKLGNGELYGSSIGNSIAARALKFTPEQCLAEVEAEAIEDMIIKFNETRFLGTSLTNLISDYVKQLREQAK